MIFNSIDSLLFIGSNSDLCANPQKGKVYLHYFLMGQSISFSSMELVCAPLAACMEARVS